MDLAGIIHSSIRPEGTTLAEVAHSYLTQVSDVLSSPERNVPGLGVIDTRYMRALKVYVDSHYLDEKSQGMDATGISTELGETISGTKLETYLVDCIYSPFKRLEPADGEVGKIIEFLRGTVLAINREDLNEMTGNASGGLFSFILDTFRLEPINFNLKLLQDKELETLYANDGMVDFGKPSTRRLANSFFRIFIDGNAKDGEPFDPEKYYGAIPISEKQVADLCMKCEIPDEYIPKFLAIMKVSKRFESTEEDGETKYCLKTQYLNNTESIAVSLLYKAGRPLSREMILEKIGALHRKHPALVEERTTLTLRQNRKPIIAKAGQQGYWRLLTGGDGSGHMSKQDVMDLIRNFVNKTVKETGKPVSLDAICDHLHERGLSYKRRSARTYVTDSGCRTEGRGDLFYPPQSDLDEPVRFWQGKSHLIQLHCANCILDKGRPCSRRELEDSIREEYGHPIKETTLDYVLNLRQDCFIYSKGLTGRVTVTLADRIKTKTEAKRIFQAEEKSEPEYRAEIRQYLIDYLLENEEESQSELVKMFQDRVPAGIKTKDAIVRLVINRNKDIFVKEKVADKNILVRLNPTYVKTIQRLPKNTVSDTPAIPAFSWEGLRSGIIREVSGNNEPDPSLSRVIDRLFFILKDGKEGFYSNETFKEVTENLFTYLNTQTDNSFRVSFCESLHMKMELYYRLFYRITFGEDIQEEGLGAIRYRFMDEGLIPDSRKYLADREELIISKTAEQINSRRNGFGHPKQFINMSENELSKGIHNCLLLMLHLAKKSLEIKGKEPHMPV